MRIIYKSILVFLLIAAPMSLPAQTKKPTRPNVILIFIDDLGYGDIGVNGALQYKTPNIDRLAAEGVRFTNFLSAQAVCSASRAALLTGCYPNRIGISGALFPTDSIGLHADEVTIAELLKQNGYATAIFGKWHLGHHKPFLPLQHGFQEFVGIPYSNDMWPVGYDGTPRKPGEGRAFPPLHVIRGNENAEVIATLQDQAKLTSTFTQQAVSFIGKNSRSPFFLYLTHPMPHVPIAASEKFKGKSAQGMYGDVVMELDWSIGEIQKALKQHKLEENTVIIFTSDNGPWLTFGNHAGSSAGFREAKGTTFEGGHRVPFIVKWKGKFPEGTVCNKLATALDLYPSIAAITGAKLPDRKIDGVNIVPLFEGLEASPRREFYYYYGVNSLRAVRFDDWKLVLPHISQTYENLTIGKDGFPGQTNHNRQIPMALYDLRRDPGERYDVQAAYPEIVAQLQKIAEEARQEIGDDITNTQGRNVRPVGRLHR